MAIGLTCVKVDGCGPADCADTRSRKEQAMFDIILLALGLGFFALSAAYAYACDWL
jgi:hypothetical protein